MTTYKHFNVAELEEIAHGDAGFIYKWLETCSKRSAELLKKLEVAFRENNVNDIQYISHQFRPSFFYLGRNDLAKILEEFENDFASLSKDEIENKLSLFLNDTKALFEEIGEVLKKVNV